MRETAQNKPYYMTTAIAYTSGKPHIGNTYEIVLADAIARYRREQGYDVRFMTGTDEHGQKIEEKAAAEGITPKEFVDKTAAEIRRIWDLMNTSYDKFIRTTDPYHEKQVQKMFKKMYDKGDIYKGHYEGWYCTPCESFWTDSQLVDGNCPDCGRPVKKAREEAYFFKMSKYADRLIEYINTHPEFIQPVARKNEMMNNFLLPGLQDLCVSRTSFKWGIPVAFDDKHVVYVWLDALSNYITGCGYNCDGETDDEGAAYVNGKYGSGEANEEGKKNFSKYWPADLHLIGKDIIRFHTIYWPIFLMSLEQPLPKQVFGHPWLIMSDGKMSKSKGNVLYADTLVDVFGVDAVRYFVLHEMPFENDGIISWELMQERFNGDLANVLGNLVSRTISMSNKYFGGIVENNDASEPIDEDLIDTVLEAVQKADDRMNELRVADAISEIFGIFRRCNKYIDETMPWALAKDESRKERLKTVLYNLTEGITIGASLLYSFMPDTAEAILAELNTAKREYAEMDTFGLYPNGNKVTDSPKILFARMDVKTLAARVKEVAGIDIMGGNEPEGAGAKANARSAKSSAANASATRTDAAANACAVKMGVAANAGTDRTVSDDKTDAGAAGDEKSSTVNAAGADGKITAGAEAVAADEASAEVKPLEHKPYINYDDFAKLELRVGEVIACEEVPKSKKLLRETVKIGSETRTILSGIKKWYKPEDMIGKKVMVVCNLEPRKIAGEMSEGMLVAAEDESGEMVALMIPDDGNMPSGSEIC